MKVKDAWWICLCAALAGYVSPWQPLKIGDDQLEPRVLAPLPFTDFSVIGQITPPSGVDRWRREKLQSGQPDAYEFLAHRVSGQYIRTETVQQ